MKTTLIGAMLITALVLTLPALAQTPPATPPPAAATAEEVPAKEKSTAVLETDIDKASYAVGIQLGEFLKRIGLIPNQELFMKAIDDVTAGREPAINQQEAEAVVRSFMTKAQKERSDKNLAAGEEFLKANAAKEGVKVLPSGLQYKVITEGDGPSPTANDKVKVHYTGTLTDGTKFDSSVDRGEPVEFGVTQVIKGWTEALQLMKKGAKWQLFIPASLGYGPRDQQKIPANSVLIFEVELLDIIAGNPNTVQLDSAPAAGGQK
ncbi:MAG TPA: FKBP-type peptidyl-prolyl cis-trans isomerase [Candidatus Hydrogenedentes bacterium]|nr:FKBP-type peptidyl-prolyl cis-trans isomerase [Candidatus Hydrogenedentota bacterium]